jgi:shikimate dehydrogenase
VIPPGIDGATALYAVLGRPIAHSLSPALHAAAFRAEGRNATYVACDVGEVELEGAMSGLRALGAKGANLTAPLKQRAAESGIALTAEARRAGAVNTLRFDASGTVGHNTDGAGLAVFLARHEVPLQGARVVFVGGGGAVRGLVPVFADGGASSLAAIVRGSTGALPEGVRRIAAGEEARAALADATLVIQATPLGAGAVDPMPAPPEWLAARAVAVELGYHPAVTPWLGAVRARGIRAANGLGMLIEQALLSQEFWHGTTPPRSALEEAVGWSDPFKV